MSNEEGTALIPTESFQSCGGRMAQSSNLGNFGVWAIDDGSSDDIQVVDTTVDDDSALTNSSSTDVLSGSTATGEEQRDSVGGALINNGDAVGDDEDILGMDEQAPSAVSATEEPEVSGSGAGAENIMTAVAAATRGSSERRENNVAVGVGAEGVPRVINERAPASSLTDEVESTPLISNSASAEGALRVNGNEDAVTTAAVTATMIPEHHGSVGSTLQFIAGRGPDILGKSAALVTATSAQLCAHIRNRLHKLYAFSWSFIERWKCVDQWKLWIVCALLLMFHLIIRLLNKLSLLEAKQSHLEAELESHLAETSHSYGASSNIANYWKSVGFHKREQS